MTEHEIVTKAEKQVKEWINYAKQEYGWEDKVFELFEEPMIKVATAVAVQTTKDLQEENRSLLESCEGATMMYKDLCEATKLIMWLRDELKDNDNWKGASALASRVNKFIDTQEGRK